MDWSVRIEGRRLLLLAWMAQWMMPQWMVVHAISSQLMISRMIGRVVVWIPGFLRRLYRVSLCHLTHLAHVRGRNLCHLAFRFPWECLFLSHLLLFLSHLLLFLSHFHSFFFLFFVLLSHVRPETLPAR
jgi:hypothetical protein